MILIGTIHTDLEGPRRLSALLEFYQPKKISVEVPETENPAQLINLISTNNKKLEKQIKNSDIPDNFKHFLSKIASLRAYEFFVTKEYCKKTGAELYLVDHPKLIECINNTADTLCLKGIESTITQKPQMAKIPYIQLIENYQNSINKIYETAVELEQYLKKGEAVLDDIIKSNPKLASTFLNQIKIIESVVLSKERDKFMAEEIIKIIPDMHIGGLAHIIQKYNQDYLSNPLYLLLDKLKYKTVLLSDADNLSSKNQNI